MSDFLIAFYAPMSFIITFLDLGPSNSQKKTDCQVPKIRRPFSMMTVSEAPTSDDLT